jgi:hypothetical protein
VTLDIQRAILWGLGRRKANRQGVRRRRGRPRGPRNGPGLWTGAPTTARSTGRRLLLLDVDQDDSPGWARAGMRRTRSTPSRRSRRVMLGPSRREDRESLLKRRALQAALSPDRGPEAMDHRRDRAPGPGIVERGDERTRETRGSHRSTCRRPDRRSPAPRSNPAPSGVPAESSATQRRVSWRAAASHAIQRPGTRQQRA